MVTDSSQTAGLGRQGADIEVLPGVDVAMTDRTGVGG